MARLAFLLFLLPKKSVAPLAPIEGDTIRYFHHFLQIKKGYSCYASLNRELCSLWTNLFLFIFVFGIFFKTHQH